MSRVKRGVAAHAKHKKVLKRAEGYYGRRKNTIRTAKQAAHQPGLIKPTTKVIRNARATPVLSDADARIITKNFLPYA
jgi:ribosomal protein L20